MPDEFEGFVYIDIDNPMAAWNVVRSNFYSPLRLPQSERANALSFGMADLLRNGNEARALAEFRLDAFRQTHFPDAVSRLKGIFVFDDIDSAAQIWSNDTWSAHFVSEYLTDVGVSADRSTRVDATWITLMRNDENKLVEGWEGLARRYWSGEPASDQPVWERIIDGYVTIWGCDIKRRALEEIRKYWPESIRLLEISANSAAIGSCDGAIVPFAIPKGKLIEVSYYLRMVDALDPIFCKKLSRFTKTGGHRVCKLGSTGESLILPDFNCYSFKREIGEILPIM